MALKNASVQLSSLNFKGSWNASTNTPTLVSSVGAIGDQYTVSVAGTTNLNGITNWAVGDTASFSGNGVWQRIPNTSAGNVVSVTGNIVSGPAQNPVITQVQSDWNAAAGSLAKILNQPTLARVATSAQYADLIGQPTIPNGGFTITTTGSSGAATLSGSIATGFTLNIPVYGNQYQLPNATTTIKGGVIIGSGVDVAADSTISVTKVTTFNGRSNTVNLQSSDIVTALNGLPINQITGNIVSGTAPSITINQVQSDWNASASSIAKILNQPTIPLQLTYSGSPVNSLMAGSNVSLELQSGSLTISSTGGGNVSSQGNRAVFAFDLSGTSTTSSGDELIQFSFSSDYLATVVLTYTLTLPAHGTYSSQTLTISIPAGTNAAAAIAIFQNQILTLRPTYNATVVGTNLNIDTNSSGNITDTTLIQNGSVTGSLKLNITQGQANSTIITITDPLNSSVYQYAPSSSQSFVAIVNAMALGETLPNYFFSVLVTTDSVARLALEAINDGNVLSANFPVMTITNPNTLLFTRTVLAQGSSSGAGPAVESITGNIVAGTASNPVINQIQPNWNAEASSLAKILNQPTIPNGSFSITTTGNSGAATLTGSVANGYSLNIPTPIPYTLPTATSNQIGGVAAGTPQAGKFVSSFASNGLAQFDSVPIATSTTAGTVKANSGSVGQFVNGIASDGSLTYATPAGGGSGGTRGVAAIDLVGVAPDTSGDEVLNFAFSSNFATGLLGNIWSQTSLTTGTFYELINTGSQILAGSGSGSGIYKSTDGGNTWSQTNQTSGSFYSFINTGTQILATSGSSGIWKSTNGGNTWSQTSLTTGTFNALFNTGNQILAGSDNDVGIYKSTDGGNTWSRTNQTSFTFLAFINTGSQLLAGSYNNGIYKSTDGGNTWSRTSLTTGTFNIFINTGSQILAGSDSGIYKSTDGGNTWSQTNQTSGFFYAFIKIGTQILAGSGSGSGIYKSTDGGNTWSQTNQTSGSFYSFINTGTQILASNLASGIYKSTDVSSFSVTLPAHSTYTQVTFTYAPTGLTVAQAIVSLQSLISASRPTYTFTTTGTTLSVDTNSAANIGDVTFIQNGSITGTLSLSITQGSAFVPASVITITDPRSGSTYNFSPASGSTNNNICNEISLGETLPGYWFYVSGSNATKTRLLLESTSTGSITAQPPRVSITNPNTLVANVSVIVSGS